MTRKYWLGVMFFSLVVSLAAGYFTWTTLKEKSIVEVPLTRIEKVESSPDKIAPPEAPEFAEVSDPEPKKSIEKLVEKSTEAVISEDKKGKSTIDANGSRNILFTYRKASAHEVFLIGSFNSWVREPMKKDSKGIWNVAIKLKPGFYEYKFIVDGRKIKDPNNRLFTPAGNSILKVKSITE